MNYDPKDADSLIPDGEYDAEIKLAEETHSKAGNAMMKLTVHVWAGGGGPRTVFDYVVVPTSVWRMKQICAALGIMAKYEEGSIDPGDIMGRALRVHLKTQKDKTGQFPDKNVIARYLASAAGSSSSTPGSPIDDSGIPF